MQYILDHANANSSVHLKCIWFCALSFLYNNTDSATFNSACNKDIPRLKGPMACQFMDVYRC